MAMSRDPPTKARITVTGRGRQWTAHLKPGSVLIGRRDSCDLVLRDAQVSREHARLYPDPFDRWVIEDLGSRNGTWVAGQKAGRRAVATGERIVIGPFTLRLSVEQNLQAPLTETATTTVIVEEDSDEAVVQTASGVEPTLTGRHPERLRAVDEVLARNVGVPDLYSEVCECLATTPETAVAVMRVAREKDLESRTPAVLAEHSGAATDEDEAEEAPFRISRGVVSAVLASGRAAMASHIPRSVDWLTLSAAPERGPRAVYCAPVTMGGDWADLLYVDIPAGQVVSGMLDFVQAGGKRVGTVARSLMLAENAARSRALDDQLAEARLIQSRLIPKSFSLTPAVEMVLFYEPAFWVGGDYCDAWTLEDGRIVFVLGDVSGKGLPAAMVMSSLQTALRTALDFRPDLTAAVSHLSRHLKERLHSEIFVTMVVGLLDPRTGRLEHVNAGHLLPVMLQPSGEVGCLGTPRNMPLGIVDEPLEPEVTVLEPGTALVLVTDGVTDARSADGAIFGTERVETLVAGRGRAPCSDLIQTITGDLRRFRGTMHQQDDVSVLALRYRGGA